MRSLALALLLAGIFSGRAQADLPDPPNVWCSLDATQRLLVIPWSPSGDPPVRQASFTVTVLNAANNPMQNVVVEVLIGGQADQRTFVCDPSMTVAVTNVLGEAYFNIGGGGCMKGAGAVTIRANGVTVRVYSAVMSPDYAGTDNAGVPGRWNRCVSLADLVAFAQGFWGGYPSCHDYNNNGQGDASDFVVFGQSWLNSGRCCP